MKVAIDAHALGRGQAGYESYLRHLTAALPDVFPEGEFLLYRDLSSHRLVRLLYDLPRRLYRDRPDVLHVQYASPLLPLPSGCALVATIHDVSFADVPEFFALPDLMALRLGVARTIRRAERVITVSEFSKQRLMAAYGIPEEKIVVAYNAAGPEFRPVGRRNTATKRPYVLMVGDLNARKNQYNLIRAFSAFAMRHPHHLLLAGRDSSASAQIHRAAKESGVADRIHFLGYVPDQELPGLYQGADLSVYPSRYEGFGLPVLEAMACGTPVVTSRTSSLPEVAGEAALLADPCDPRDLCAAMEAALRDSRHWRDAGLERARHFSWRESARQTCRAYFEACPEASLAGPQHAGPVRGSSQYQTERSAPRSRARTPLRSGESVPEERGALRIP